MPSWFDWRECSQLLMATSLSHCNLIKPWRAPAIDTKWHLLLCCWCDFWTLLWQTSYNTISSFKRQQIVFLRRASTANTCACLHMYSTLSTAFDQQTQQKYMTSFKLKVKPMTQTNLAFDAFRNVFTNKRRKSVIVSIKLVRDKRFFYSQKTSSKRFLTILPYFPTTNKLAISAKRAGLLKWAGLKRVSPTLASCHLPSMRSHSLVVLSST